MILRPTVSQSSFSGYDRDTEMEWMSLVPVLGGLLGWQKWHTLKIHYEQCWDEREDMGYGSLKEGGDMTQNWN